MKHLSLLLALATLLVCAQTARAASCYLETTFLPRYDSSNKGSNLNASAMGGIFTGEELRSESGFSYDLRNTVGLKFWQQVVVGFTYNYSRSPSS
ncbi:MAG TPA: hypothetical protein VM598_08660, partial [Bdellovibrionota bacterium]|nr:hypothetical protein [Bdellovibrionota bacterium]